MTRMIFPNLPVKDLQRSVEFYTSLGFEQNMQFTDENATAIVISDSIVVMLLTEPFFQTFTSKSIANAKTEVGVINALSCDSRQEVDELMSKALAAGANEHRDPQEMDFMYGRAFEDPDGHLWELFWMNAEAMQPPPQG